MELVETQVLQSMIKVLRIVLSCVYFCYLMCIVLLCVLDLLQCWLEVSIRKVLQPATSVHIFLGFPVSKSEC
jgi:hypothetical protein